MGILIAITIALGALGACYSPTLRDCTLECTADADCVTGQTCSDDRLCTSSSSPRRCALANDAGRDVRSADVAHATDSATTELLHVKVDGNGSVELVGSGLCDSAPPQNGDCKLPALAGVLATLVARPHDGQMFDRWTSAACAGQGATCSIIPAAPMEVIARFVHVRDVQP